MKLGKTEKVVICKIADWPVEKKVIRRGKRYNNAVASLKRKGLIMKEDGCVFLKFTDFSWDNMPLLKRVCGVL